MLFLDAFSLPTVYVQVRFFLLEHLCVCIGMCRAVLMQRYMGRCVNVCVRARVYILDPLPSLHMGVDLSHVPLSAD